MGRIKKKNYTAEKGNVFLQKLTNGKSSKWTKLTNLSNGKIFCFKNKSLYFSETKKFSTESFLTFTELQPLVSYKQVSYIKKKNVCIFWVFRAAYFAVAVQPCMEWIPIKKQKNLTIFASKIKIGWKWPWLEGGILFCRHVFTFFQKLPFLSVLLTFSFILKIYNKNENRYHCPFHLPSVY